MNVPAPLTSLVRGVHHIAIVVPSIAAARKTYEGVLGLTASEPEFVPEQKVNVLVTYAGSQRIELVEPASDDSPVTKFLAKTGGGLHHVAYKVDDVAAAIAACKAAGLRLIDESPRNGAHHTRIAFLHPSAMGGVLTELVQDTH